MRLASLALLAAVCLAGSGCAEYVPVPPPAPVAASAPMQQSADQGCREFRQTALVGGQMQEMIGTACPQPDGTWRIVGPAAETAQSAPPPQPPQVVYVQPQPVPYPVYAAPAPGYYPYYGYGGPPPVSVGLGFVFSEGGGHHHHHRYWR